MINIPKLKGKIIENNMSISKLANALGISSSSLYQKINLKGNTLTVEEVINISKILHLSRDEFNNIFFTDFVA